MKKSTSQAFPTSMDDLRSRAVLVIWSPSEPNLAALLNIGKAAAYRAAHSGQVPVIRVGRRLLIPCDQMARLLREGQAS